MMETLATAMNRMPRIKIGTLPTPLHRLENFEKQLNFQQIFIKRDDMTGLGPGGNKIRSLEFILGEALHAGCDIVLVAGPLQSNLCTLTACACVKVGIRCITIHNGVKPDKFEGNLLLNKLLNVNAYYLGNVSSEIRNQHMVKLAEEYKEQGKRPYIIENGGTSGIGALGYVWACVELQKQVEEQKLPLKTIFAPGGNGGVATGLIYGNALLGMPFEIVIISVESDTTTLKSDIRRTISQVEQTLGLPFEHRLGDVCQIVDEYRGAGWGVNTVESEHFVQR
ncbi:MAG: pyridoxal-phosphate dependent enzyme, partial [Sporomusa sp.]